jgi:hypothetical protein
MSYSDYYILKHHCNFISHAPSPCADISNCPVPPIIQLCQTKPKDKSYDIMAKHIVPHDPCTQPKPTPCHPYFICMCNSKVENECYCRNNIR